MPIDLSSDTSAGVQLQPIDQMTNSDNSRTTAVLPLPTGADYQCDKSNPKRCTRRFAAVKSIWVLVALCLYLSKAVIVFMGIEGTNARFQSYKNYIEQEHFNHTHSPDFPADTSHFDKFYEAALNVSRVKCELVKLEVGSWNRMSFSESFQYAESILTTVGWGVFFPRSTLTRVLTIVYALMGIPLFAAVVGQGVVMLAYFERASMRSRFVKKCVRNKRLFRLGVGFALAGILAFAGTVTMSLEMSEYSTSALALNLAALGKTYSWDYMTTFYYLFTTVSTIGFGDLYHYQELIGASDSLRMLRMCALLGLMIFFLAFFTRVLQKLSRYIQAQMNFKIRKLFVEGYMETRRSER